MRSFFILIILFFSKCYGQSVSEINKRLSFSDKFEFEREIRIYKYHSTSDQIEIFRMYDKGKNDWSAYIYYYSNTFKSPTKINEFLFPKEDIGDLKIKDAGLIWMNLLLCDIEYLPNMKDIRYKLKKSSLQEEKGVFDIISTKISVLDGKGYIVFIKNYKNENEFSFDNPEIYLEDYPNVDELISYSKILSVIRNEFNLLKD